MVFTKMKEDIELHMPIYLHVENMLEETTILENNEYKNVGDPYDLGFCYGNIIVAKYGSSLKKNIHKIIDEIITFE